VRESDLSPDLLTQMLVGIFADPADLKRRAAQAHALAVPDAAGRLADLVESIAA
jgi:UDP-N-acetylglucosamine:LPS N-acetylglucosamine transferase